ncbi:hypothetical protein RAN53_06930 [Halomonas sp. SSL-5]|uniref:hypothetical protein n=1 Tax=Halomonas sp. SSL-5 TaxID=3065855 RepID=UPI0027382281|nr:hypothetical protein [Halomonas sp. SSL-5]MDY7116079.1 hypothetical protein [Halomonas sp. SSL-5]
MTTTTTPRTDASRQSWWARLSERCYRATTPRLVQDIQHEAAGTYNEMLEDLKTPLDAHFEREMARQLESGRPLGFKPARNLMPVMMQRFGLQDAELAADPDYAAMRATCNACPVVGQCWKAMRAGAEVEECRGFCPNAAAFDSRAAQ